MPKKLDAALTFDAREGIQEIKYYLKNHSVNQERKFANAVDNAIDNIRNFPFMGKKSEGNSDTREILFHKKYRMTYQVDDNVIRVINIRNAKINFP